jgi:hypothetical protein
LSYQTDANSEYGRVNTGDTRRVIRSVVKRETAQTVS